MFVLTHRNPSSFWTTTGLYPQEFVVELDKSYDVGVVRLGFRTLLIVPPNMTIYFQCLSSSLFANTTTTWGISLSVIVRVPAAVSIFLRWVLFLQVHLAACGIKTLEIHKSDSEDATNFQMVSTTHNT